MVLFGRTKEPARILALTWSSREIPRAMIEKYGCGKSSLLAENPKLHGDRTLTRRVNPSESSWLGPILERTAAAPVDNGDPLALSSMLLTLLQQRSVARTVVLVDDADEVYPASPTVLGFLTRHLAETGIVLIVSVLLPLPDRPFAGLALLHLLRLNQCDIIRTLESVSAARTSTAAIFSVATATQGHPLASIGPREELLGRQLKGQYSLPIPLHWKGSFETDLAASISRLSLPARETLNSCPCGVPARSVDCGSHNPGIRMNHTWTAAGQQAERLISALGMP
ncbi:MAG: hypothetical protein U1D68_03675 [Arthrobacter sp.]|nr:hypothetical protein [Arthrobacter sp.]MDZ4354379.1 hypothetical protein [Arthrobacter sp.]